MLKGSLPNRIWSAGSTDSANLLVVGNYGPQTNDLIDLVNFVIGSLNPAHPEDYLPFMDYKTHITTINLHACTPEAEVSR